MKRSAEIGSFLKPLSEAPLQAYLSNAVQVADIIDWVVSQIGECELIQTSFSISEEFLRRLYFLKARKAIKKITLVLDHKATNMTIKLWVFINELVKDTYLADNHSKILLFSADSGEKVAVITSQNLTRGNRHESTVITTDPGVFDAMHESVRELIRNQTVPLSELMNEAVNYEIPERNPRAD